MKSLEGRIGRSGRYRKALAALAFTILPYVAQAGHPHAGYFFRGKKADTPAPAVSEPRAQPAGQFDSEGARACSENNLGIKANDLFNLICTNAPYAGHSDMFAGSAKGRAVARINGEIVPVDVNRIEVKLSSIAPGLRGEYIALQGSNPQERSIMLGRGPALEAATFVVINEAEGIKYLQAFPNKKFVLVESATTKADIGTKKVYFPGDDRDKPPKREIRYNKNPKKELLVSADIYYVDDLADGRLDLVGFDGDLAGQVGEVRSQKDRWGLSQYNPRYENMLYAVSMDITGLELSSQSRIEKALDRSVALPVPVPTPVP